VATVAGAGISATVIGVSKGTATIEAADSQTDCSKSSRSVWVIAADEFDGITDKKFCANAIGEGDYKVACSYGAAISGKVLLWVKLTFKEACRGEGSAADAAQHARWSCELYSSPLTKPIAAAILRFHENRPTDPCISHEQDFNNNAVGRQNAASGGDCTKSALQALAAGRLQVNRPPPPGVTCP
jgi:hypothetical protein